MLTTSKKLSNIHRTFWEPWLTIAPARWQAPQYVKLPQDKRVSSKFPKPSKESVASTDRDARHGEKLKFSRNWIENTPPQFVYTTCHQLLQRTRILTPQMPNRLIMYNGTRTHHPLMEVGAETKQPIWHEVATLFTKHRMTEREPNYVRGLVHDTSITILSNDKERARMVMDKLDYLQKIAALLNDYKSYRWLSKNTLTTTNNHINQLLDGLRL